jgi:thiol-disulfide isomerase/thioredoxin
VVKWPILVRHLASAAAAAAPHVVVPVPGMDQLVLAVDTSKPRVLVVNLFQYCCPSCHTFAEELNAVAKHFRGVPQIQFLAVQASFEMNHVNTSERARQFQLVHKLDFPVAQDALIDLAGLRAHGKALGLDPGALDDADVSPEHSSSHLFTLLNARGSPWLLILKVLPDGTIEEVLHAGFPRDVDDIVGKCETELIAVSTTTTATVALPRPAKRAS